MCYEVVAVSSVLEFWYFLRFFYPNYYFVARASFLINSS